MIPTPDVSRVIFKYNLMVLLNSFFKKEDRSTSQISIPNSLIYMSVIEYIFSQHDCVLC